MVKKILLAFVLCLFAATAFAAPKDFEQFTIDMADGWEMMAEPIKNQGVLLVILGNEAKESAINVALAPTQGEDAKALADATMKNMAAQKTDVKLVKADANRAVLEGKKNDVPIRIYLMADPANKSMATVVLSGNNKAAESVLKTLKFKNTKLALQ